jgi:FkbM family methyltransferase
MARKIRSGAYDVPEIALLSDVVRRGDTVVDVGANYGLYSFHLARLVGESGRVVAFEAAPSTALALGRVLRALGVEPRIRLVQKAVGETAGQLRLAIPRRADGSTESGLAWIVPSETEVPAGDTVDVAVASLDDEVGQEGEIAFMKIDVEGADLHALRGAVTIIARDAPTILVEVSPPLLARQGVRPADIDEFFDRRGYATYRFEPDRRRLRACPANEVAGDLLAVHARRRDRLGQLISSV